jgi:hypothetical protein
LIFALFLFLVRARARHKRDLNQLQAISQPTSAVKGFLLNTRYNDASNKLSSTQELRSTSPNNPLSQSFTKTVNYLRSSHDTPKVSTFTEVASVNSSLRDPDSDKLQHAFEQEINKFNKVKLQKQVRNHLYFVNTKERS